MSKVLISFLGTSRPNNRQYNKATYAFDDGTTRTTSFIAEALAEYHHVDKMILIGTAKSMWEEVYYVFAEKNNCLKEEIYDEIAHACTAANHTTALSIPHIDAIEEVLGKGSKIMLIKYGLNSDEIEFNASQILSIEDYLSNGDQIIVDITHSFRSLPMLLMNALIYLQNVSRKNLTIERVTNGMLDVTTEMGGKTPVVDLSNLLKMSDWIAGAYAFAQFGNAYKISELMEDEDKSVAERLRQFSDILNLNHIALVKSETSNLSAIKTKKYASKIPEMILTPIVRDFLDNFSSAKTHGAFQFQLAKWQFEHHNYCAAYITLQEAIITYVCEQKGLDHADYYTREDVKKALKDPPYDTLSTIYKKIKKTRNSLAHNIRSESNSTNMISSLRDYIQQLKDIIK